MRETHDFEQDWPADQENTELARLAGQLQEAVPGLSATALARVEQQMHAELDRGQPRGRWRRVLAGWSVAAAILIAIGAYAYFRSGPAPVGEQPFAKKNASIDAAPIEDHIMIAVGTSTASMPAEQPLVRLDDYRSLFAD